MDGDPAPFEITEQLLEDEVLIPMLTCSVSLLAGHGAADLHPEYCGSATLVSTGGKRCLLTAEHVWKLIQNTGETVFLSRDQKVSASRDRTIAIEDRKYIGSPRYITTRTSDRWGPDLALLEIPDLHADLMQDRKAFYDLDRRRKAALSAKADQNTGLWAMLGSAADHFRPGPDGLEMQAYAIGSKITDAHEREGFDYLDLRIDRRQHPDQPATYRGFSGAGLWRCSLKRSPTGKIECNEIALEGVAFYEDRQVPGFIRCHGRASIYGRALKGSL
jgi:hypothetical protein